jgi:hypothetical protein
MSGATDHGRMPATHSSPNQRDQVITPLWEDQWRRCERYLQRITGRANGRSQLECCDDVWAFFIGCWHLSDAVALALPNVTGGGKSAVRKFQGDLAAKHQALAICHDVANGFKHVTLSRPLAQAQVVRGGSITIGLPCLRIHPLTLEDTSQGDGWALFEHVLVAADGNPQSAEEVAYNAIADWEQILIERSLLLRT